MTTAYSIALQPSRALAAILLAGHAAALACALAALSGPPLWLVAAGVIVAGAWSVSDALLKLPGSVIRLEIRDDGTGCWLDRAGRVHDAAAVEASWVACGVVVVGMRASRLRSRWITLFPDSAGAESLRGLRVRLRWHGR